MARIEWVENRLRDWARWRLTRGTGKLGYASMRYGPELLSALEPYADAPVPTNAIEAAETDGLVALLPGDLRRTVEVWYVAGGGLQAKLRYLCCAERTLHDRIERAQRLLAEHLHAKRERQGTERRRVEQLQASVRP